MPQESPLTSGDWDEGRKGAREPGSMLCVCGRGAACRQNVEIINEWWLWEWGEQDPFLGPTFLSSLLMMNYGKHPAFPIIENHGVYVTIGVLFISE